MSTKQIIQNNQNKLLQILLYKEYLEYHDQLHSQRYIEINHSDSSNIIILSFEEWIKKILEDF